MRIDPPVLPPEGAVDYDRNLRVQLVNYLRKIAEQINLVSEGRAYGTHNAATAAPSAGSYAQGDVVKNSAPVEAGTVGNRYVVTGWVCVASGTPGTWREMRVLTGN